MITMSYEVVQARRFTKIELRLRIRMKLGVVNVLCDEDFW